MPPEFATPPPPQSLKQRVLICLTKLSDRDTYALAATELDSIARSLDSSSFPIFLSCIQSTDAADKSPVRKQCVNLLATLSLTHGDTLSPHLAKMLSTVTRRLRDPDSAVRSACVNTVSTIASRVTKPSFESFVKAFADALFTEQDVNAQMGAALCLASAIDSAPHPEPAKLGRLLPRFEKLLKSNAFKANAGVLTLIRSVVGVGGAENVRASKNLLPCVMGFLSSEDWATRKAAAEVLLKLAVVERDSLAEYKPACIKVFNNRRFDKVKAVREVMNEMLEAWKQVPDVSDEVSRPNQSMSSSKENASDAKYTAVAKNVSSAGTQMRKKQPPARSTTPDSSCAATARKISPLKNMDRNTTPAITRKADRNEPSDWKVEIAVPNSSSRGSGEDDPREGNENILDRSKGELYRASRPETRRALFSRNSNERVHKLGGFRSGSRVAPCNEESSESNIIHNLHSYHKDCEDLSSIRNQLVQIEKQQSSVLDLLQKFMGSSQIGMRSLETRVHGLELALDEISYDLAVTSGRMTQAHSSTTTCCMFRPEFFSSRFWRKHDSQSPNSRFAASFRTPAAALTRLRADRMTEVGPYGLENGRFQHTGGAGFIVNPLAKILSDPR